VPTYGAATLPIESARGHAWPASVADAAAPHGCGLKGGAGTHTSAMHHRSTGNASAVRRVAGHASLICLQPCQWPHAAHTTPSRAPRPCTRLSILPQVVLVGPEAPQQARRWPVRLWAGWSMRSLYVVASMAKCSDGPWTMTPHSASRCSLSSLRVSESLSLLFVFLDTRLYSRAKPCVQSSHTN
jgi:hypothetical protein